MLNIMTVLMPKLSSLKINYQSRIKVVHEKQQYTCRCQNIYEVEKLTIK
jgi:hypothetical protein